MFTSRYRAEGQIRSRTNVSLAMTSPGMSGLPFDGISRVVTHIINQSRYHPINGCHP
ncbi:hypothetical protein BDZ89DRAFT_1070749, partial [Hymenopellis radicata]